MNLKRAAAAAVLFTSVAHGAGAATITSYFDDRAGFEAAVTGEVHDDLNGAPLTAFNGTTLDLGAYSVTHSGSTSWSAAIVATSGFTVDGTRHGRIDTGTCCGDLLFTFDTAITAFGLDTYALNDGLLRTPIIIDGVPVPTVGTVPGQDLAFVGYVSDMPFNSILFKGDVGDSWGFDNIVYATAPSTVPLPAGLVLLGTGLFALPLARRRRRA